MKEEKKKAYKKPEIVYEKKIEVLSVVCNSSRIAPRVCMKAVPCTKLMA